MYTDSSEFFCQSQKHMTGSANTGPNGETLYYPTFILLILGFGLLDFCFVSRDVSILGLAGSHISHGAQCISKRDKSLAYHK